jgi:hypothetical protein
MWEVLNNMKSEDLAPVLGVIGMLVCGAIAVLGSFLGYQWRRVRVAEMEIALKQQMIDKGMSAAEIVQVMRVSSPSSDRTEEPEKANIAKHLAWAGMSGEGIERVIRALQDRPVGDRSENKEHLVV